MVRQELDPTYLAGPGSPGVPGKSGDRAGEADSLLRPGRNCWRCEHADQVAWLIDGESYFAALADAINRARSQVWILAWDLDTRIRLNRAGSVKDTSNLGELLRARARAVPDLAIHVLNWDAAAVFSLSRQWFAGLQLGGWLGDNIQFASDGYHAAGACHHQKIVVIDDRVAFCGGMDLTARRWDNPSHRPGDRRRVTADGSPYQPRHDVQILVAGAAAAALGELARRRWQTATGEDIPPPAPPGDEADSPWPASVSPTMTGVDVGIARTMGAYREIAAVREVEKLYLDCIAAARRYVYLEHQYYTSHTVCAALEARLREPDCPEVVIVLPRRASGWLEDVTIGALRLGCLKRLEAADRADRLRILYSNIDPGGSQNLLIHSKVMVADDRWLRVGSANLSNRSMGLDSECDLMIEASSEAHRAAVRRFLCELVGEHSGVGTDAFDRLWQRHGSLLAAIRAVDGPAGGRHLADLPPDAYAGIDAEFLEDSFDPEEAVFETAAFSARRGTEPRHGVRAKVRFALVLTVLLALAAGWAFTPVREWLTTLDLPAVRAQVLAAGPAALVAAAGFVVGSLIAVPVTLMVALAAWLYGAVVGLLCSLLGIVLSATVTFGLGSLLGRDAMIALAGTTVDRVSRQVARRGVLAVATLRLLPIAPYTVVNLVAGASQIRFADFIAGTLLGMAPGVTAIVFVIAGAKSLFAEDQLAGIGLVIGGLGLVGAAFTGIQVFRRLRASRSSRSCES